MMIRCSPVLCLLLLLGGLVCLSGQATPAKSVWDGIYTEDQASRGEPAYRENCASCHGTRMEGRGQTPPLAGSDFLANWNGMTVGDLLEKMRISMPADRPGRLSVTKNADILAYILSYNRFPSGARELPTSADALKTVRFEGDHNLH